MVSTPNFVCDQKYEIISEMIDYGSFGDIVKVNNKIDKKIYAMKRIKHRGHFEDDPYIISEIYCLTKLKHKNIILLNEIIIDSDEIRIVMEYAERENLERYILSNENIEFHHKFKIYSQILEGVNYCHSMEVAHRDLTPANILLTNDFVVKIADFGLSVKCVDGDDRPMLCKDYLGRTAYLPPEVLSRTPFLPKPADIWSLGVTLLFLLFKTIPLQGFHEDVLADQLNHSWELFVVKQTKNGGQYNFDVFGILALHLALDPGQRIRISDLLRLWHSVPTV